MQTNAVRLIDYFDGTKQSVIPLFQRKYSWTKKNWDNLWEDILELIEAERQNMHFMGAIVSAPAQSVPVGVVKHLIIDGQQRLTTFAILLCALREELGEKEADRIGDLLTNRHYADIDNLKLLPTQGDREVFVNLIRRTSLDNSDNLIAKSYKYFLKRLREEDQETGKKVDPAKVMEVLSTNLRVVMISLDEKDDPYVIFESLNYQGLPLTHGDLIRNFILMRFASNLNGDGEQENIYKSLWSPIELRLGDKLTTYLMHYGRRFGTEVRKSTIYSYFKEKYGKLKVDELKSAIADLAKYSEYYARFLSPDLEPSGLLRLRLKALQELDMSTCYPLLLNLYGALSSNEATESDVCKCLEIIESYVVRRSVVGLPNNAMDQIFVMAAASLNSNDAVNSLTEKLKSATGRMRWPSDAEFEQAVLTQPQYGKKSTKYVLGRLEEDLEHREPVDLSVLQIEHVLPQKITPEWEIELGIGANEVHDLLLHTLGNLTLTGYNPVLGNIPFPDKCKIYSDSHIGLTKWISSQATWNKDSILNRARNLAEVCIRLWPAN